MPRTWGYHIVKCGYGLWLPGDDRGSWSEAWDDQVGFIEPHTLHAGDPVRLRMSQERMRYPPLRLTEQMMTICAEVLGECAAASPWSIAVASIEPTHTHLLLTYSPLDIDGTIKWLGQMTTKAIHQRTPHVGPVWAKGHWCSFIFSAAHWDNAVEYIERHNVRRGEGRRPYGFLA